MELPDPSSQGGADESDEKWSTFRDLLESQHEWPSIYLFKFIVPVSGLATVEGILVDTERTIRESKRGNYVSVTARFHAGSAEAIIDIYKAAGEIEGVISL